MKVAQNIQTWWDIKMYASNQRRQSFNGDASRKMLESTKRISQARDTNWEGCGVNQSQTCQTTIAQPWVSFTH